MLNKKETNESERRNMHSEESDLRNAVVGESINDTKIHVSRLIDKTIEL